MPSTPGNGHQLVPNSQQAMGMHRRLIFLLLLFLLLLLYAPGRYFRVGGTPCQTLSGGLRKGERGWASPSCPPVPEAEPGVGRGAGSCLAGFRQGRDIAGLWPGHCWCPQGIAVASLRHHQGISGPSWGHIQALMEHLWSFTGPSLRPPQGIAGTWQPGVTLFSFQGLLSEQQVRAGCPGPHCTWQGDLCLQRCRSRTP